MSTLVLLVVLLCLVIAAWLWKKPHPRSPSILPGALPFIGHLHLLLGDRIHLWDLFRKTQLYTQKQGGICEVWFGPHSVYVITDLEGSLAVSNTCLNKPYLYDFAKEFINNGLVTAEGTSLRLSTSDQVTIDTDYSEALHELLVLFCDRVQKVWLHLSYIYKWSGLQRRENQLLDKLKDIMNPIIRKRKSELKPNNIPDIYNEATSTSGKFKPIIDQMLQLAEEQNAFTDDDIREHVNTLILASYDTTASALTIILLVIGRYQNVQERIFNELQEVFEHDVNDITKQDLQKLVYLEAVIKESMRLYPVAPIIARKVDVEINLKNCTLRAGSTCAIGLYGLLRHPLWGTDAELFRPERWLDPNTLPSHPSLYAAFGVGKRNCIGKVFSMMVMKMALAHIIRRYHVTGDIENVVCEFDVVLKPVKGHHICLTPRS